MAVELGNDRLSVVGNLAGVIPFAPFEAVTDGNRSGLLSVDIEAPCSAPIEFDEAVVVEPEDKAVVMNGGDRQVRERFGMC